MKKLMKKMTALLFVLLLCGSVLLPAQAKEVVTVSQSATGPVNEVNADKIVMKTRTEKGKLQYRRWNETKHCWVDPAWIDFPGQ